MNAIEPILKIDGFKGAVVAIDYAPKGGLIAIADETTRVSIVDSMTGKLITRLEGYESSGSRLRWSPDSARLFRLSNNQWISSDLEGKNLISIACGFHGCRQWDLSSDGSRIAVAGNGKVGVWSAADGQKIVEAEPHPNWRISHLVFSPDGKRLATACDDRMPLWLSATDLKPVEPGLPGSDSKPVALAVHPKGSLLRLDRDAMLHRMDPLTGKDQPLKVSGPEVVAMDVSKDGQWVGFAGGTEVRIFGWSTGVWKKLKLANTALGARSIAFSPDGECVAVGDHDSAVKIWSVSDLPVSN